MKRRSFLGGTIAAGAILGHGSASPASASQSDTIFLAKNLVIERDRPGQPHKGKVLAAIQPHSDDIPIFAAGTVAKLIREGYTGYLIRTSNDDHAGPGSVGDTVVANEIDNDLVARALGLKKVFNLGYRNHQMEDVDLIELKARLIFLFRVLKVEEALCDRHLPRCVVWVSCRSSESVCRSPQWSTPAKVSGRAAGRTAAVS